MAIDGLFNTTINLLGRSLDLRAENHNRISANIANAETPGYSPTALSFDRELQDAVRTRGQAAIAPTHPRHIPLKGSLMSLDQVTGTIVEDKSAINSLDRNGVELENEMGKMVQNQIMFTASIQLLTKKFEGLKTAIKGGV
jgi:flagellar basal-body rod protein FlgB